MSRSACTFKQSDVVRAVKSAKAAGIAVAGIEIKPDGSIIINAGAATDTNNSAFDAWKAGKSCG